MKKFFFTLTGLILSLTIYSQSASFTDNRDGQVYQTIKIGTQTWMAQNLNYATETSRCYDDNENNCRVYGKLYKWVEAKTACPAGWHLPTWNEFNILIKSVGGEGEVAYNSLLKGGNSGFSSLLGGWNNGDGFSQIGSNTVYWSSHPIGDHAAMELRLNGFSFKALMESGEISEWQSIRCLKNN